MAVWSASYRRAPKGAGDTDYGTEGPGVCHLCTCGMGVDWEDLWPICCLAFFLHDADQITLHERNHTHK